MTITYHAHGPSYSTDPTARALGSTFAMSTSLARRDVSRDDVPRRDCAPVPLDLAGLYPNLFAAAETAHRPARIAIALNELLTALKRLHRMGRQAAIGSAGVRIRNDRGRRNRRSARRRNGASVYVTALTNERKGGQRFYLTRQVPSLASVGLAPLGGRILVFASFGSSVFGNGVLPAE